MGPRLLRTTDVLAVIPLVWILVWGCGPGAVVIGAAVVISSSSSSSGGGDPGGLRPISAEYLDVNDNGILDSPDEVTVQFSGQVVVQSMPSADTVFALVPSGQFGPGAVVTAGATNEEVVVTVLAVSRFRSNGAFRKKTDSTGLNIVAGQGGLTSISGQSLRPRPEPIDLGGELRPRVARAGIRDRNVNGTVDAGDTLKIRFTAKVTFAAQQPGQAFSLPVQGDSFGTGAQFLGNTAPQGVDAATIVLGSGPTLTITGTFDPGVLGPGSPSGIDLLSAQVAVDAVTPEVSAAPLAPPGVDVGEEIADWTSVGDDVTGARFGTFVATAGDVDGDGYSDIIVGALGFNASTGKAYVYHGSPQGPRDTPAWESVGDDEPDANFGRYVGTAGDVDGDGYSDIIVGAYGHSGNTGKAFVYLGGPGGLSQIPVWTSTGDDAPRSLFGVAVATAGDVDADGYDDVLVGAAGFEAAPPLIGGGKAYLFHGGPGGPSLTADWESVGDAREVAVYGRSLASAGDVNDDGFADAIIGAPWFETANRSAGKVYVYLGGPTGLSLTPVWTSSGDDIQSAFFGESVASAGDVDDDGFSDIIVGASSQILLPADFSAGKVFLYLGTSSGPSLTPVWTSRGGATAWASFGESVGSAGDTDGDGFSDIIIGASGITGGIQHKGEVFLFRGTPSGTPGAALWRSIGDDQDEGEFGISVGTAGDVNGDGYSDTIVGSWRHDTAFSDAGKVYVFFGSP